MNVGSLFSGIGGIELGFERAGGFDVKWFVENNLYCQAVLKKHWPSIPIYGDIAQIDFKALEPVDILTGGFPCQDISVAGKGAGINGARSGLWKEYLRAIGEIRPRVAFIENVSALRNRGLETVLCDLAEVGYDAEWHCVPASAIGAPHRRDRIYIMAYRKYKRQVFCKYEKQPRHKEELFARNDSNVAYCNDNGCFHGQIEKQSAQVRKPTFSNIGSKSNMANGNEQSLERRQSKCGTEGVFGKSSNEISNANNGCFTAKEITGFNKRKGNPPKGKENSWTFERPSNLGENLERFEQRKRELAQRNRETTWATDAGVLRVANGISPWLYRTFEAKYFQNALKQDVQIGRKVLREMWKHAQSSKTSPEHPDSRKDYCSLSELPQEFAYIGWLLGKRIEEDEELCDMWQDICSTPFEETQNLQQELLKRIGERERIEKMGSERINRIKCIGNAVVPQCAEFFAEIIKEKCLHRNAQVFRASGSNGFPQFAGAQK